jgi:hypothetical protein
MRLSEDRVADSSHRVSTAALELGNMCFGGGSAAEAAAFGYGVLLTMFHSDAHLFHDTQSTAVRIFF